jgi:hypothetical protein
MLAPEEDKGTASSLNGGQIKRFRCQHRIQALLRIAVREQSERNSDLTKFKVLRKMSPPSGLKISVSVQTVDLFELST